ncbi:MAG: hypothetical protein RMX68_016380 [Aulosira sp. ZfuVER01]|nr:hypothetical protein [Aulosira sp. ZfuVER01]MDZ8002016.1 hypothetical protein [Aulosira sp. DedVER01a]MDZ8054906.1 hypothetical protein [Aulosira sp. ZfuCHP01]
MSKSNNFYSALYIALSTLTVTLSLTPANALPGQNITTVVNWAKTRETLPAIKYNSEAHGYEGTKGKLYFYADVTSQNGTVTKEGITVSGDSSLKFTKKNAKALKLVQDIYNSQIAKDFKKSRYVTKIDRDQFYSGEIYGYIAAEVQDGTNLRIVTLKNLQAEIKNARYCQTHQCDL